MRARFAGEYIRLKYDKSCMKLAGLPKVSRGFHKGTPVIRITSANSNGRQIVKEYRTNSPKAVRAEELMKARESLIAEIKSLTLAENDLLPNPVRIKSDIDNHYNGSYYKMLVAESNSQQNKTKYYHKDIHIRSRAEMLVAEVLDELQLQYKYEPAVEINGVVYYPDFVVYIEAIDCCFFIEVMGMSDNYEYMMSNVTKLFKYADAGMLMNENLLLIPGTVNYMPDTDYIYNSIVSMVNLAVWRMID